MKAKLQDKPAFNISKSSSEDDMDRVNGDLLDMGTPDCAGNRYNFNNVILKTRVGFTKGLPNKTAVNVAKAWKKLKAHIEAKTDPGGKKGYKIQVYTHDPGPEFEGAMRDELATDKVINRVGEVDRHSDGSIVENRNKQLQINACAMAITAMGENVDQYWQQAGCELISWCNELYNHTSITKNQKEQGKTAHQEQYDCDDDLEAANEIPIRTWGELTYIYVNKKDRHGKLSPRAIRCIWNGRNQDNIKLISGIALAACVVAL